MSRVAQIIAAVCISGAAAASILAFGGPGCTPAAAVAGGDAAACIVSEAMAGRSIAQIAAACAVDVATVLVSLERSPDSSVQKTPAMAEARAMRAALAVDAGR